MSFTIKGIHPHDIATILDDDGVAIRAGHHCCQILHDKLEFLLQQEHQLEFIIVKKILMFYVTQSINVKKYFRFKWNLKNYIKKLF